MSAARRVREGWGAGDRIGKMSISTLRDIRLRVEMRGSMVLGTVDTIRIIELLESIVEAVHETEDDTTIVVEEIPDAIRRMEEQRLAAVEEKDELKAEHAQEIGDLEQSKKDAAHDHELDIAAMGGSLEEMRRRVELAEERAEQGASERNAVLAREVSRLTDENEAMTKALEYARQQNPMRVRPRRVK